MAVKYGRTDFLAPLSINKLAVQIPKPLCQISIERKALWTGAQADALPEVSQLASQHLCIFICMLGYPTLPHLLGWMERSGSYIQKYFSKSKPL